MENRMEFIQLNPAQSRHDEKQSHQKTEGTGTLLYSS